MVSRLEHVGFILVSVQSSDGLTHALVSARVPSDPMRRMSRRISATFLVIGQRLISDDPTQPGIRFAAVAHLATGAELRQRDAVVPAPFEHLNQVLHLILAAPSSREPAGVPALGEAELLQQLIVALGFVLTEPEPGGLRGQGGPELREHVVRGAQIAGGEGEVHLVQ